MIATLVNTLLCLLIAQIPAFNWMPQKRGVTPDSIPLKYIDLSHDSLLLNILNDAMVEYRRNGYANAPYFELRLSDDKDDYLNVSVTAHTKDMLFRGDDYSGFFVLSRMPVIIRNFSKYSFNGISEESRCFPMEPHDPIPCPYDPDVWYYIVKDGDYARFVYGIGWLWGRPYDSDRARRKGKYRLTRPNRKP